MLLRISQRPPIGRSRRCAELVSKDRNREAIGLRTNMWNALPLFAEIIGRLDEERDDPARRLLERERLNALDSVGRARERRSRGHRTMALHAYGIQRRGTARSKFVCVDTVCY